MAKKKTLCLVMIVKNESKVIHRCLDSIRDYLDYWVIHDTGSTDNTPSLIETYFQNAKIPGKLYHTPWVDFGYNRTQAVQSARNKADYLILMDADFICQIKDPLFKTKPMDADAYMIKYEGPLDYRQNLFVKGSLSWKYIGVTHEYIHSPESKQVESGDFLTFIHPGDGGCRSDKFERDIRLLHQGLEKEPKNIRYMFYLAQSYKDVQNWDNAIIWYQKRIDAGGWPEEVYYAMYQIGMCKMRRGDSFYNFMGDLVAAFMFRPVRLEALFHLIHYCYQNKGLSIIGYQLGKMAINTEYPKDLLFVEKVVHDYLFLDALSICAVNAGKFKKACQIITRVLSEGRFPERDRQRLESNQKIFKQRYQEYLNKIKGQDLQKIKQQPRWALKTPEEALEANQSTALAQAQAVAKAETNAKTQVETVAKADAHAKTVTKAEAKTPSTDKGFSILNPTKSVEVNAQNTNESEKATSVEVAKATSGEAEKSNSEAEKSNSENRAEKADAVKIRSLTVRKNPIWISLTSIPSRMGRLTKTLESLKAQTTKATRINLCLPEKCLKESDEYQIPPEIANDPAITIVRTANDWGPATKLIGSLCICDDPETRLIVVDDDIIYPSDLVTKLVARSRDHPDSAIGFCGWQAKDVQKGREHFYRNLVYEDRLANLPYVTPVDVLEGYRGVLSKRRFWDLEAVLDYSQAPKSAFFVDDVWLSGHLARRLVPRLAFKYDQGSTLTADQAYGRVWVANQLGSKEQNNSLSTRVDFVEANQQTAQYFWNSEGQLHRTVDEVQTYMTKEIQKKMTIALKAMPEASSLHEVQIKSRIQANYQSAIIIPTYNRPEYLQWTLKTLTGSQLPDDCLIILVDDASESDASLGTDSSKASGRVRQLLEQMNGPSVISCYKSSNQGVFHSLRLGIKIAQIFNVQRYCLLDSDTMVRSDWFTRLTDFYDNNRECLVSGFNLGNRQHHTILESLAEANRRQSIGGVNMYFSAELATKFLPLMNDLRWDYQVCLWCQMNRVPIFTLKPSVVQHIGIKGMFSSPEKQNNAPGASAYDFDFAYDFYLDVAPEFGKDQKDQMNDQVNKDRMKDQMNKDRMNDQMNKEPEYCWLPGVDFPGFNLEQVLDEAGITAIKARASQNPQVVAWNASGWLKTKLEAPNKWEIDDVNRSLGLFVKRSAYSEFGLGPLLRNSQSEARTPVGLRAGQLGQPGQPKTEYEPTNTEKKKIHEKVSDATKSPITLEVPTKTKKPKVGFVIHATTDYKFKFQSGMKSFRKYCQQHEYDYLECSQLPTNLGVYFGKVYWALQYLKKYDYLVVHEADMTVVNYQKSLNKYFGERDLTLTYRLHNGEVSAACWIIKNTEWSHNWLNSWLSYSNQTWSENRVLNYLIAKEIDVNAPFNPSDNFTTVCGGDWTSWPIKPGKFQQLHQGREYIGVHIRILNPLNSEAFWRCLELGPDDGIENGRKSGFYSNKLWRQLIGNEIFIHSKELNEFAREPDNEGKVRADLEIANADVCELIEQLATEYNWPLPSSVSKLSPIQPKCINQIVLLTEYYRPNNSERCRELDHVLKKNLENPAITKICLFTDQTELIIAHPKVQIIQNGGRLTYKRCFQWINEHLAPNTICVVANADIYYDQGLSCLSQINFQNLFIALLRYNVDVSGACEIFKYNNQIVSNAQDTWIFKTPIKIPEQCDFFFGKAGCDNRLAFEMLKVGYNLINCPYDIKSYHYHLSEYRTYNEIDVVPGPYLNLIPSHLEETMMTGHHHENFARHHENFARNCETKYHFWGLEKTECAGLTQYQILNHLVRQHE